jgi:hypothetical protein
VSEQQGTTMDIYEVELEPAEPDGFAAIIPALPGLLVLGSDVDDVLRRVRVAIAFHAMAAGCCRSGWLSGGAAAASCWQSRMA